MINPPDTSALSSALFSFAIQFQDLIVNWKNFKQGLPKYNLDFYSLLGLSNNQLTGQIPSSLGGLKSLKLLDLSHNSLHGNIPTSIGDLQSVENLDLAYNTLSGGIPTTFAKLQQLTTLDLSNNKLQGRIPRSSQLDTLNDPNIYANNSGICGVSIRVDCPEDKPPPVAEPTEEANESFSWQAAGIAFPAGFIVAVVIFYIAGFFSAGTNRRSLRMAGNGRCNSKN